MRIHRQERAWYTLDITTEPAVTGPWDASFDGGTTWTPGEADGDGWRWLLAGPDADDTDAIVVSSTVSPLVRNVEDPELIIRDDCPRVTLYP